MEDLVKTQLQPTLEAMARKMLPDLAERILKQEIRRMLEEQR
jgi:cell pole-organizing protein PopZ